MSDAPASPVNDTKRNGENGAAKKKKWPYSRPPDIADLRTRDCWICREEETFTTRQNPPARPWIHPCKCTLIAHESCLLEWLARSEGKTACPQCSTRFIITSRRPFLLKTFEWIERRFDRIVRYGFVVGVTSSMLILSTVYGAHAVRMFVGRDLYSVVLGGGPSRWPLEAWTNFPFVAPTLFFFRLSRLDPLLVAMPFLMVPFSNFMHVLPRRAGVLRGPGLLAAPYPTLYPPTPQVTLAVFPIVKVFYSAIWRGIEQWVLREKEEIWEIDREREQILDDAVEEARQGEEMQDLLEMEMGMDMADEDEMGREDEANRGGLGVRLEVNIEVEEEEFAPAEAGHAPGDPDQAAAPVAEQHNHNRLDLLFNGAPVMRWLRSIMYTLAIPTISNISGHVLLLTSHYSLGMRKFLGVESPMLEFYPVGLSIASMRGVGRSSPSLTTLDPVWWRNTLGLCLFVVVKDSVELLHAWLKREERRSRRVAGRSFEGLEVEGLDLIV